VWFARLRICERASFATGVGPVGSYFEEPRCSNYNSISRYIPHLVYPKVAQHLNVLHPDPEPTLPMLQVMLVLKHSYRRCVASLAAITCSLSGFSVCA